MRHANKPTGPGKPTSERRASASESEQLEQLNRESRGTADSPAREPSRSARQGERDAHTGGKRGNIDRGTGRQRSRP